MPGHPHNRPEAHFQFNSPGVAPFFNFIESLASDVDTHPIFAWDKNKNHPHGRRGGRRTFEKDGISVSPLIHKWRVNGETTTEEDAVVSPLVDVYDTPDSYIVIASVPGASSTNIDVDFDTTEHELIISGVLNTAISSEDFSQYLKIGERKVGKFERRVTVPAEPRVDDEDIKAKYSNGVLKVILPKIQPVQPEKRRIVVTLDEDGELEKVEEKEEEKEVEEKEANQEDKQDEPSTSTIDEDSVMVDSPTPEAESH